ncbi:MAG: fatty acid--CoA ligase family protein [Pseudomonadota bacterium]
MLDILFESCGAANDSVAVVVGSEEVTYKELLNALEDWTTRFEAAGVQAGHVVLLKSDFSREGIAALLSLLHIRAIVILLAPSSYEKEEEFSEVGEAGWLVDGLTFQIERTERVSEHPLYQELRRRGDAGIVLFSSGSSGTSKGTVHSARDLLKKFETPGKNLKTLAFLLFDHIAGLDTLFYSLFNSSTLVVPHDRSPDAVCGLIDKYDIEVLPTAPSFLNLMLISAAHERHDLSTLKIVTYGSEMMPESTLQRCAEEFPQVRLLQKYGTSEIGALPTKSKSNTSTWLKLGGDGFEWRERDGKFEVKAKTAMLGYLNAPSPFTDDGFFMTGDQIETDGDYVRFLGRESDIINVGGQKVYPAEVENLVRALSEVSEVSIYGEPHAILGAAVVAKIRPADPNATIMDIRKRVVQELSGTVERYKIPQKYILTQESLTTARGKQIRGSKR